MSHKSHTLHSDSAKVEKIRWHPLYDFLEALEPRAKIVIPPNPGVRSVNPRKLAANHRIFWGDFNRQKNIFLGGGFVFCVG